MNSFASTKIVQLNATLGPTITDNLNHIRHDVNLYWLVFIVSTVIVGIYQTFFQCLIGVVVNHNRTLVILWLMDILSYHHIFQVFQSTPQRQMNRTTEWLCLSEIVGVAIFSFGIEHNINLCSREELLRMIREHHQCHILNARLLYWAFQ